MLVFLALSWVSVLRPEAHATQGSIVAWDEYGRRFGQPVGDDFVAVAAGFDHSLALRADGSLVGWGGIGPDLQGLPAGNDFVAISAGHYHALALKDDHSIVAWGDDGQSTGRALPPPNVANEDFKAIAGGAFHNLALKTDGSIVAWGSDGGSGRAKPPPGVQNTGFKAIAAGENHNLALREDGTIVAWGEDLVGEVSDAPTDGGFVDVAVGFGYSMARREDGTVVVWGAEERTTPFSRVYYAIASGNYQGLGLYGEGRIGVIWTDPWQLDGSPKTDGFIAIASGQRHALAIKGVDPGLTITAPVPGTTIAAGSLVEIAAAFSAEPPGVVRVQFFAGATLLGEDTVAPYAFEWEEVPPGIHPLSVRAVLGDGSSITSSGVSITADAVPVITSPAPRDVFYLGNAVTIDVEVPSAVSPIEWVEFRADGSKIDEDKEAPYSLNWIDAPVGDKLSLFARVVYAGGHAVDSKSQEITILAAPPQIVEPVDGQRFTNGETIPITANFPFRSGFEVARVDFFDGTTKIGGAIARPYTFEWHTIRQPGRHALRAQVVFSDGLAAISSKPVFVLLADKVGPTIVAPADGDHFLAGQQIPISVLPDAKASDIVKMMLVVHDGQTSKVVGTDNQPPYAFDLVAPDGDVSFDLIASELRSNNNEFASGRVRIHVFSEDSCLVDFLARVAASNSVAAGVRTGTRLAFRILVETTGIDLDLLRQFRDEVLLDTPAGRYFANLYETASPALISAVLEDPSLIVSIYEAYDAWALAIQAAVDGNTAPITVTSEMTDALMDLLPRLRMVAEKDLRDLLQREVEALEPSTWSGMTVASVLAKMEAQARPAPVIANQSTSQSVSAASALTLAVEAEGPGPIEFQWYRNTVAIPGATESAFTLPSAQAFHAGNYSVVVSNPFGAAASSAMAVTVEPAPPADAGLANLSTRAVTQTGDGVLIPGFVVSGGGSKLLLMRVVGPTLGGFGVDGTVADPRMTLKRSEGETVVDVASNDNWSGEAIAQAADALGAFALEAGSADAALLQTLTAGQYTIVAEGVGSTTGIALVEFYDADPENQSVGLANISARTFVGPGGNAPIPGFVISGDGPRTVLIRAVGPGLAAFGVQGTLPDPQFTMFAGDQLLFANDDWGAGAGAANTEATADLVGAFELAADSKDAAMVVTLAPGAYTVVVSDAGGASGVALVEVYLVP